MIHENSPVTNSFVSVPADMVCHFRNFSQLVRIILFILFFKLVVLTSIWCYEILSRHLCEYIRCVYVQGQLNCAAYLAGILAGILDSAKFVSQRKYM